MSAPPSDPSAPLSSVVWCLLVLTLSTGIVDSVAWIALEGVFAANMTGNVLIVGMGLGGGAVAHGLPAIVALITFLASAAVTGLTQRNARPGWGRRSLIIFGFVIVVEIAVAIVIATTGTPAPHGPASYLVLIALTAAMGAQGAEAVRLGTPLLSTVAVSSVVVILGTGLLGGGEHDGTEPRGWRLGRLCVAIVALALGALVGTLLQQISPAAALAAAAGVALVAVMIGAVGAVRHTRIAVRTP